MALDRPDGAVRVGDCLAFGDFADEYLAVSGERNNRWCGAHAFCIGDDLGCSTNDGGYNRIRGSEVDSYCFTHGFS